MKINYKKILTNTALIANLLAMPGLEQNASAFDRHPFVRTNVSQLNREYEELIRIPVIDPASGGDLEIQCINMLFFGWTSAYLFSIAQADDITPEGVGAPLDNFTRNHFLSEDQLKLAEFFRPGSTLKIYKALEDAYVAAGTPDWAPAPGGPALSPGNVWINLGDYGAKSFSAFIRTCISDGFRQRVAGQFQMPDLTRPIPAGLIRSPSGKIEWIKSTYGGFSPIWKNP